MQGICLTIYTQELLKHQGMLLYEWILEKAKAAGIPGGSVFRTVAGYGRHGILHEEHFLELASNVPIKVELIASSEQILQFIQFLKDENIQIFYVTSSVEFEGIK